MCLSPIAVESLHHEETLITTFTLSGTLQPELDVAQCVNLLNGPSDIRPGQSAPFKVQLCDSGSKPKVYLYYRPAGQGAWQKRPMTNLGGVHSFSVAVTDAYQEGMEYYIDTDGAQLGTRAKPKFVPTSHL